MAWEKRGNKSYLYRKRRIRGKVKSVYAGSGDAAVLLDRLENRQRALKKIEKEDLIRERLKADSLDKLIDSISAFNKSMVDALFLLNGYHQHKRQWRKKLTKR